MPVMPTAGHGDALPGRDNAFELLVPNAACYVNTQAFQSRRAVVAFDRDQ